MERTGDQLKAELLNEANLERVALSEANLKKAKVTDKQLDEAKSLAGETLPDSTKHDCPLSPQRLRPTPRVLLRLGVSVTSFR